MSFSQQIKQFRLKTEEQARQFVIKLGFDLFMRIVDRSPVDTGRFRANNQISINSLPQDAVMETDASGNATIRQGNQEINSFNLGDTVFLFNNLEYALPLEYGHSGQAPQGIYRISFEEIINHLSRYAQ